MPDREKIIKESEKAIDILAKTEEPTFWMDFVRCAFENALALLKEQEAKTGHWIISEYEYLDCSCCGNSYYTGCDSTEEAKMRLKKGFYFKYCPYCGAKMEEQTRA